MIPRLRNSMPIRTAAMTAAVMTAAADVAATLPEIARAVLPPTMRAAANVIP